MPLIPGRTGRPLVPAGLAPHDCGGALAQVIDRAALQVEKSVDLTRRPPHFDLIDPRCVLQPEVEPGIARGLVARTADSLPRLAATTGHHAQLGAYGVAVGLGPLELEGDEMSAPASLVMEIGQWLILG